MPGDKPNPGVGSGPGKPRVVIAGGGVAGLETILALDALARDHLEVVLVAPQPDFVYLPELVEEPFDIGPAARRELAPAVEALGGEFVLSGVSGVRPDDHIVELSDGEIGYDMLVVCSGGRLRPAFAHATSFPQPQGFRIKELLAGMGSGSRLAFVVPGGVTWALPVYELAMLAERHIREAGREIECVVVTPEEAPLIIFGEEASNAVAGLLAGRGIEVQTGTYTREGPAGGFDLLPSGGRLVADEVIAMAQMEGRSISGLPYDEGGFLPIDEHCRVRAVEDIWAAGDGTNFPIKQGGLGTQQADAAAEEIAARAGADVVPAPFHPVLRGQLITGEDSLSMRQEVAGGKGDGVVSADYLWWPPRKIAGRYLAPWLSGEERVDALMTPESLIDVDVEMPADWYESPMSLDPYSPPPKG